MTKMRRRCFGKRYLRSQIWLFWRILYYIKICGVYVQYEQSNVANVNIPRSKRKALSGFKNLRHRQLQLAIIMQLMIQTFIKENHYTYIITSPKKPLNLSTNHPQGVSKKKYPTTMFFQPPVVFNEKNGPRLAPPSGVDSAGRNCAGDGGGPIGAWVSPP